MTLRSFAFNSGAKEYKFSLLVCAVPSPDSALLSGLCAIPKGTEPRLFSCTSTKGGAVLSSSPTRILGSC